MVLALVKRTAQGLTTWLATPLTLKPDQDTVDALTGDRDALWARLQATSFLTDDEKRAAIGYGPKRQAAQQKTADVLEQKYPGQPRTDDGRYDFGPDGSGPQPAAKRPTIPTTPPPKPDDPKHKTPKPGLSGKEAADDVPSWAKGERPFAHEDDKAFAKRLLDAKYGDGKYQTGATSEFSRIQKYGDRAF